MTANNRVDNSPTTDEPPVLSWTVHLVREQPGRLVVVVPVILVAAFCAYSLMNIIGVIAVGFVLAASLSDFLFPVYYELTHDRAVCKRMTGMSVIRWEHVRRCYLDDFGVKLSPLHKRTRLEPYRGVYLRFGHNKDQVIDTVRSLRGTAC